MKVCIYGAGAIGGFIGTRLAAAGGCTVAAVAFEFAFMGGSMASVGGEKFARAAELALDERMPF